MDKYPITNFSSVRRSQTMRPQQDFSKSFCFLLLFSASLMFIFVARISLVHDLNGLVPIPAERDSPCRCKEAPLTSLSAILFVSIMLRFLGPGGDHSLSAILSW